MAEANLTYDQRVKDFMAQKRIAISGLSRNTDSGAGAIYLKLRQHGYDVFAVHPEAESLHGDKCYPNLHAIPGGVDAVFIMNSPDISEKIVDEAAELGIKRVWMHNNTLMPSSASEAAVDRCRADDIHCISVGCPMMFFKPDLFHGGMGWFLRATGKLK